MLGFIFRRLISPRFRAAVKFGDIVRGLPLEADSCDAIFCCHVLEHLALEDFKVAIRHTQKYLKPGGTFRQIVPDFDQQVAAYLSNPNPPALSLGYTHLGRKSRPKGKAGFLRDYFGNSHHLWMWDYKGIAWEFERAGFVGVRRFRFGEAAIPAFCEVENEDRFLDALAVECGKAVSGVLPARLACHSRSTI